VELLYRLPDPWKRKLFIALCRRYGLEPFRESGRRYSTIQVHAPQAFHDRTLWPEFLALSEELDASRRAHDPGDPRGDQRRRQRTRRAWCPQGVARAEHRLTTKR
jgi:hypothetical protein